MVHTLLVKNYSLPFIHTKALAHQMLEALDLGEGWRDWCADCITSLRLDYALR